MMRIFFVSLCFLFSVVIAAQTRTVLSGVVSDENNQPVEIATIRVEGTILFTMSDLQGKYTLNLPAKDSVVVVFSMIGYRTTKRVLKKPKGRINLNVKLQNLGIELGEVTIQESRRQTGFMEKLDPSKSKLMPNASGGGIESYIATQVGVSSTNELSSQYNVRGGSFDENSVYVNGIEIYKPLLIRAGEQEGLSFINPDMVAEIDFSAGGYEAKYGDKMASVLDITYKKPTHLEASGSLALLGATAYVGYGTQKFSMTHGLRYKTNRYLLQTLDTKGEYDPHFIDYQTYLTYSPSSSWEIGAIGNFAQNSYRFIPQDRTTKFGTLTDTKEFKVYFEGQEKDLFQTYFGSISVTKKLNEYHQFSFLTSSFKTKEQETYDILGQYWLTDLDPSATQNTPTAAETAGVGSYLQHARNYLTATVQSYSFTGTHKIESHLLKWGTEFKREKITDKIKEWEMRDSAGYSLPHTAKEVELIYSLSSNQKMASNRSAFYIQDIYKFQTKSGLFTLTGGIRGSYWDWNKEFILSPRASIGLIPVFNENYTFRFATGVYYQAPFYKEFRDTTIVAGNSVVFLNQAIKSQRSIHFVLAADYKFRAMGRPFKFTTELYYKKLTDLIPYNVNNVKVNYYGKNMADGYAMGIDMKLFGEFVPGTDSWLTLSIMKTEETINGKTIPRPTDQRYNLSFFFTDYFPNSPTWRMNLKASWADGLPFGAPHKGREFAVYRTPGYKRVDIGVSKEFLTADKQVKRYGVKRAIKSASICLDVFNLLDVYNVNSYYWVTDIYNQQYAVPNYLTARQLNLRLLIEL